MEVVVLSVSEFVVVQLVVPELRRLCVLLVCLVVSLLVVMVVPCWMNSVVVVVCLVFAIDLVQSNSVVLVEMVVKVVVSL